MTRIIGNLDDLATAVQQSTQQKMKDRRGDALQHAQEIKEDAQQKAERVQEEILAEARRRADEQRRQRLAEAEQAAKRKHLTAREEILDQVWEQAEGRLHDLVDSDDYDQTLRQLAWLAVQTLGVGRLNLAADAQGHELLTEERLVNWAEEAGADFDAEVEFQRADDPLDAWGGLIASRDQGKKRMDARFSERLEIARDELRDEIFNTLVEES